MAVTKRCVCVCVGGGGGVEEEEMLAPRLWNGVQCLEFGESDAVLARPAR